MRKPSLVSSTLVALVLSTARTAPWRTVSRTLLRANGRTSDRALPKSVTSPTPHLARRLSSFPWTRSNTPRLLALSVRFTPNFDGRCLTTRNRAPRGRREPVQCHVSSRHEQPIHIRERVHRPGRSRWPVACGCCHWRRVLRELAIFPIIRARSI